MASFGTSHVPRAYVGRTRGATTEINLPFRVLTLRSMGPFLINLA